MAGARAAFRSIAGGRGAIRKERARALVLFGLALAGCSSPEATAPVAIPAPRLAAMVATPAAAEIPLDDYRGLGGAELGRILGSPDFRRRDADAEIWQYRAGACMLDLFLYREAGVLRVAHVEARHRASGRPCSAQTGGARAAAAQGL
jgi:hypothetical protein